MSSRATSDGASSFLTQVVESIRLSPLVSDGWCPRWQGPGRYTFRPLPGGLLNYTFDLFDESALG